jgi:chromosome segregation ATPase
MGVIWGELKDAEVRLQNAKADLDKAEKQSVTCKEGLQEVKQRLRSIKDEDVVLLENVIAAQKDVETVEKFYYQSNDHASILKATIYNIEEFKKRLQEGYDKLGVELVKADLNIVYFGP